MAKSRNRAARTQCARVFNLRRLSAQDRTTKFPVVANSQRTSSCDYGLLVAVFIFFLAKTISWQVNLLAPGYDVVEFIERRHTYGAQNDNENCDWPRRKAGGQFQHLDADLPLLQSSWRPRSCFLQIGRRPMKAASASGSPASLEASRPRRRAGLVAGEYLLPHLRIGRRRRRACA